MSRLSDISASPTLREYAQGAAQDAIMPVADFLAPTVEVTTSVGRFKRYTASIRDGGAKPKPETKSVSTPRLLRRAEVARLLSRTTRSVDHLARDGILKRVSLPGRSRAAGFRESDVLQLIASGEQNPHFS